MACRESRDRPGRCVGVPSPLSGPTNRAGDVGSLRPGSSAVALPVAERVVRQLVQARQLALCAIAFGGAAVGGHGDGTGTVGGGRQGAEGADAAAVVAPAAPTDDDGARSSSSPQRLSVRLRSGCTRGKPWYGLIPADARRLRVTPTSDGWTEARIPKGCSRLRGLPFPPFVPLLRGRQHRSGRGTRTCSRRLRSAARTRLFPRARRHVRTRWSPGCPAQSRSEPRSRPPAVPPGRRTALRLQCRGHSSHSGSSSSRSKGSRSASPSVTRTSWRECRAWIHTGCGQARAAPPPRSGKRRQGALVRTRTDYDLGYVCAEL